MADRILMTPQELNDGAAFLRQRLSDMEQEVAQIQNKIAEITAKWEGASQQAFVTQWESEMYPILKDTVPQVLEGVASELDVAANGLRSVDAEIAQAYKGS